jgi:hypothetical protein
MPDPRHSFTDLDLAFFRAGDEMGDRPTREDADEPHRPPSLWARIAAAFKR